MKFVETIIIRKIKQLASGTALLAGISAASAMPPDEPLAAFFLSTDEVFWEPNRNLNYGRIVVNVSTPSGDVFTQTFLRGSIPFFPVLEDGTYSYELYLVPPGVVGAAEIIPGRPEGPIDENGRPLRGNTPTPPQTLPGMGQSRRGIVQSGYFTVTNGMPADTDLQEVEQ